MSLLNCANVRAVPSSLQDRIGREEMRGIDADTKRSGSRQPHARMNASSSSPASEILTAPSSHSAMRVSTSRKGRRSR
jgi:hypothetical protein